MSDEFLTRFRKAPRPQFEAALYERISAPMNTQPKFKALRTIAFSMAALVVAMGTLVLISPPARALAEDIWRQVGGFVFVQGNPDCAPPPGQTSKTCTTSEKPAGEKGKKGQPVKDEKPPIKVTPQGDRRQPDATAPDAAGASALIGFTVLSPGYVPEGFTPDGPWGIVNMGHGTVEARFGYSNGQGERLVIGEAKYDPSQPPDTVVRPEVSDATVNGLPGVWLPGSKATLIWEDNGIIYSVTSVMNTLSKDELMKVAESLGK